MILFGLNGILNAHVYLPTAYGSFAPYQKSSVTGKNPSFSINSLLCIVICIPIYEALRFSTRICKHHQFDNSRLVLQTRLSFSGLPGLPRLRQSYPDNVQDCICPYLPSLFPKTKNAAPQNDVYFRMAPRTLVHSPLTRLGYCIRIINFMPRHQHLDH